MNSACCAPGWLFKRAVPAACRAVQTAAGRPRLAELRRRLAYDEAARPSDFLATSPTLPGPTPDPRRHLELPVPISREAALVDRFKRRHTYLRISLTERCNLRCTYCMPAGGIQLAPPSHLLTADEIIRVASIFVGLGVNKIRLTGGEPTLRSDLVDIVSRLKRIPGLDTLGMTTNGITLSHHLLALQAAGLTHLNISLDTLQRSKFEAISRRPAGMWNKAWDSIHAAIAAGYHPVKVNAVITRGVNDDELPAFVELTTKLPIQVRFIELMPFAGNSYDPEATVGWREMIGRIQDVYPSFEPDLSAAHPTTPQPAAVGRSLTSDADGTARMWHVPGSPGRAGFISTMTDAFCGTCNRLRLTADGSIKACLHGTDEHSIRDALRSGASDEQVTAIVHQAVLGKHAALGGSKNSLELAKASADGVASSSGVYRPMIKIGG